MDIKQYIKQEGEKPLDNIVQNGGLTAIFRTIACVGDSLSSGEFEVRYPKTAPKPEKCIYYSQGEQFNTAFFDMYEYSWGQFIGRMTGAKVYNFSCGGLSAHNFFSEDIKNQGYFNEDKKAQAYIFALGHNDLFGAKKPLGDISDIDLSNPENNKDTFAGNYARLVCMYKKISPNAKFFFVTLPKYENDTNVTREGHANILTKMAEKIENAYCIDLYHYGPVHNDEFRENFYLNGHLSPAGYYVIALTISSYIDYIIRNNPQDFKLTGLACEKDYPENI